MRLLGTLALLCALSACAKEVVTDQRTATPRDGSADQTVKKPAKPKPVPQTDDAVTPPAGEPADQTQARAPEPAPQPAQPVPAPLGPSKLGWSADQFVGTAELALIPVE